MEAPGKPAPVPTTCRGSQAGPRAGGELPGAALSPSPARIPRGFARSDRSFLHWTVPGRRRGRGGATGGKRQGQQPRGRWRLQFLGDKRRQTQPGNGLLGDSAPSPSRRPSCPRPNRAKRRGRSRGRAAEAGEASRFLAPVATWRPKCLRGGLSLQGCPRPPRTKGALRGESQTAPEGMGAPGPPVGEQFTRRPRAQPGSAPPWPRSPARTGCGGSA